MHEQQILLADDNYLQLDKYIIANQLKRILLVSGNSLKVQTLGKYFDELEVRLKVKIFRFGDYEPNPKYESVVAGVKYFRENGCDSIVAVGGGSAMDVAKCIKLFADMDNGYNYLEQAIKPNEIRLLAIPTTAGSGSEATRFAVIYYKGEKQSVSDYNCIPDAVLFDKKVLFSLPQYHKKATMLDALCHAIESFWSVNSNEESRLYAKNAIELIMSVKDAYLFGDTDVYEDMLRASNLAGKAINITQTTAGHAMCYKLTTTYGIAHGHAAALCVSKLFGYMYENIDKCIDIRGEAHLANVLDEIANALGYCNITTAIYAFEKIVKDMNFDEIYASQEEIEIFSKSVNPDRLKNHPVKLDEEAIRQLYQLILE